MIDREPVGVDRWIGRRIQTFAAAALAIAAGLAAMGPAVSETLPPQATAHPEQGRRLFGAIFVDAAAGTAPNPTPADEHYYRHGLGPRFNNVSCERCHAGGGRGRPLIGDDHTGAQLVIRASRASGSARIYNGPIPDDRFGTVVQTRAVDGDKGEAVVALEWLEVEEGRFSDGERYSLRRPRISIVPIERPSDPLPADLWISARIPLAVNGVGGLEAIPAASIRANADALDENGDGISGRFNWVWSFEQKKLALGRFGWKAENPTIRQQTAEAFAVDIGVTSPMFTEDDGGFELSGQDLDAVVAFVRSLPPAPAPGTEDRSVSLGSAVFAGLQCDGCHLPQFAAVEPPVRAYTDLLLHDMGAGLADDRPVFEAWSEEWRTPPLWGLGAAARLPETRYLHDGRARTLSEAILWHGGEAATSRQGFLALSTAQRQALLQFLESL